MVRLLIPQRAARVVCLSIVALACCACGTLRPAYDRLHVVPFDSVATDRAFRTIADASPADSFSSESFSAAGYVLPYRMLTPLSRATARVPLVIVLHGSGQIGTDNASQLGALARSWARPDIRERFPALVVVPQFSARSAVYAVDPRDSLLSSTGTAGLTALFALVDHLIATQPVDPRRIYITGFSMGGSTSWDALVQQPTRFAAAIPISGIAPPRVYAAAITAVPMLIVHGTADRDNLIDSDRAMFAALRAAGSRVVRFREYIGLDHRVPPEFITDLSWRTWLFAQRRP